MKAKELRFGNWVEYEKGFHTITTINFNYCDSHYKGNEYRHRYTKIEPIPLTEDWLIKFGFTKVNKYSYWLDDFLCETIYINLNTRKTTIGSNEEYDINHIKHVHQLQNLYFALTGEEL